jgi:carboxymethylenebutenolidase
MAELLEMSVDGVPMTMLCSTPSGAGPHPAIIVVHHRDGFDDFTKKVCDDLAAEGFVAVAPDFYHWLPVLEPARENPFPTDDEIVKDVNAAVDWLKARDGVDGGRIGILGHCMGGRMSFLGASTNPAIGACVVYYGGNMFKPWGGDHPPPFDKLPGLKGPVIGFFGNDDGNPSPDDVNKIDAELTKLGKAHEFHRYDGAGHAFQNFCNAERYREAATQDSWAKTTAFLHQTFG